MPRGALDARSPARKLVEWHAGALERRMHRRHLVDRAAEALEHGGDIVGARRHRPFFQHGALGVARARAAAELERRHIFLVRVEQRSGKLGRLAE